MKSLLIFGFLNPLRNVLFRSPNIPTHPSKLWSKALARPVVIENMKKYLRLIVSLVVAGYLQPVLSAQDLLPPEATIEQAVDHYIQAEQATGNITPAPQADDYILLRRTMLDLIGRIPTVAEVEAYVADEDPEKRVKLVDRLMQQPEFVEQLAYDLNNVLAPAGKTDLELYLADALNNSKGWGNIFADMIYGNYEEEMPKQAMQFVNLRINDIDNLTNATSALFFGVNISCAKCHDHPLVSEWTQAHFYGMKSFFNRSFSNGDFVAERAYGEIKYANTNGEQLDAKLMFLSGSVIEEPEPVLLDDEAKKKEKAELEKLKKDKKPTPAPEFSRRAQLIEIALRENDRDYFSKNLVNRMWNRMYGHGLVMPLDQMHPENPPSHPDLLDWLARDTYTNDYNIPRLIRGLILSKTYSQNSVYGGEKRPAKFWFAMANVKPMSPRQYAAALALASRNPAHFDDPNEAVSRIRNEVKAHRGWERKFVVPGERFQVSVDEALLFSNADEFKDKIKVANDRLGGELAAIESDEALVQRAIRTVYSRPATAEELEAISAYVAARSDRREEAISQIVWALLTSSELRFNH
ncbi:MAG: DUF1549 domain-containing protein [Planctomycetaceae bacterium]|nr:DUF1549 domain-containing protein [Planctomycetaceae bacterium]